MTSSREPAGGGVPFDTSRAHMARVYDNTHQVAQQAAPDSRVVYVDNDPIVLAHARVLLTSSPEGATAYIDADLRATAAILERAADVLDFVAGALVAARNREPWQRPQPGHYAGVGRKP